MPCSADLAKSPTVHVGHEGLSHVGTRRTPFDLCHGDHYLATEPRDPMHVAIVDAIRDYEAYQAMALERRKFVEARHDWDKLAKKQAVVWRAALCQNN